MKKTDDYQGQGPTSRQADALRRSIESNFEDGLPASEFLASLSREPARAELIDLLIRAAVPARPDAPRWMKWLCGGAAPHVDDDLLEGTEANDYDAGLRHPRTRYGQSAGRLADESDRAVGRSAERIRKLQAEIDIERRKIDHADGIRRAAVAYALFDGLARRLWSVFALGPAYTLMRAVSDHVVGKRVLDANGGACEAGVIAQVYAQEEAKQVRDTLAALVGDGDFERDLYDAIKGVVARHSAREPEISEKRAEQRRRFAIAEVTHVVEFDEGNAGANRRPKPTGGLLDF